MLNKQTFYSEIQITSRMTPKNPIKENSSVYNNAMLSSDENGFEQIFTK